ncbi:MAG: FAD-dependent oxidoreductase [Ktedonobacterales bacterium]|nr:FAD-dependent oxidoreductase [Ktedonobacterales bacterium]
MDEPVNVPVAIIGAGPVGLTAAVLLARSGTRVMVLERHSATSFHPRARGLNVRTMEIYRGLGLAEAVTAAGAALAASKYMLFVETLAGAEIRRVPDDDLMLTGDALAAITPSAWVQCAQDELEPLLLHAAQAAGAEVRFNTEMTALAEDADGVTLTLRAADGTPTMVRADYVIAADGAKGQARAAVGIPLIERAVQGHYINIYFQADLRELVVGREFALCFVENPDAPGIILAVNNTDRWLFNAEYDPTQTSPAAFTPERCRALVRAAVGIADLPVTVLSVLPWDATAHYAPQMATGRVFLAGDAAHTMPPAGGLGLNTGIADAHNLAWKLAMVVSGQATPALLATYEVERLPVARDAVEHAARELEAERPDGPPQGEDASLTAPLIPILGFTYHASAIIPESDTLPTHEGLDLSGRPGTRLPHVWLEKSGRRISSLDIVGHAFMVFLGPGSAAWEMPWRAAGIALGVPLAIAHIGPDGLRDPANAWGTASGTGATGALLVRPDGVVAWRATSDAALATTDPQRVLAQVLGRA